MSRKKIVFIIVEGPSDDTALGVLLNRIYDPDFVHVHITHGDITSDYDSDTSNIIKRIQNMVDGYAKSNHLSKSRFLEIVHIADMDGAYIPDDSVIEDVNADKPFYTLRNIRTDDPEGIRNRNQIKRLNLNRLCATTKIWGIPYQIYYMSCNLDHVFYDKQNSSDEEKETDAINFAKKYKNRIQDFISLMSDPVLLRSEDYVESWKYIREDHHSLERCSNLGICLNKASLERSNE